MNIITNVRATALSAVAIALLTIAAMTMITLTSCSKDSEALHPGFPADGSEALHPSFHADGSRALTPSVTNYIYLNTTGAAGADTKQYTLTTDADGAITLAPRTPAEDKIFVAPGTTLLPVYAFGTVAYQHNNGTPNNPDDDYTVRMPVCHANPTTPVTWAAEASTRAQQLLPSVEGRCPNGAEGLKDTPAGEVSNPSVASRHLPSTEGRSLAAPTRASTATLSAPAIALNMTPLTARVSLVVKGSDGTPITLDPDNGDAATLHGINAPTASTTGGTIFQWNTTTSGSNTYATLPPTLAPETDGDGKPITTIDLFDAITGIGGTPGTGTLPAPQTGSPAPQTSSGTVPVQIIPATVPTYELLLTITSGGNTYRIIATRPYAFLAGYEYTLTVTIANSGEAYVTHVSIVDPTDGGTIGIVDKDKLPAGTRLIFTETDLRAFANEVNATDGSGTKLNAIQMADITLSGGNWKPIGDNSTDDDKTRFAGTYHGNGYTIKGLTIDRPNDGYQGLFGYTETTAVISGVHLEEVDITGGSYTGGLVGRNEGTITACYATGAVSGIGNTGGLVGWNNDATITACYATGSVTGTGNGTGGLVGLNNGGTITACYATGGVTGRGFTGGLVGNNSATITACYATGSVTGTGTNIGTLVGLNYGTTNYSNANGTVNNAPASDANLIGGVSATAIGNTTYNPETEAEKVYETLTADGDGTADDPGVPATWTVKAAILDPATGTVTVKDVTVDKKKIWNANLTINWQP